MWLCGGLPNNRWAVMHAICKRWRAGAGERYLSTVMMAATRDECERMGVNQRVLLSDQAGRQFYVPPLG